MGLRLLGFSSKRVRQNLPGRGGDSDEDSFCFGLTLPCPLPQKQGRNGARASAVQSHVSLPPCPLSELLLVQETSQTLGGWGRAGAGGQLCRGGGRGPWSPHLRESLSCGIRGQLPATRAHPPTQLRVEPQFGPKCHGLGLPAPAWPSAPPLACPPAPGGRIPAAN